MKKTLTTLTGSWTLYILWILYKKGPSRFKDLENNVSGISPRMLTERLKMLSDIGLVERHKDTDPILRVTYTLSNKGKDLSKVLNELYALHQKWAA